MRGASPGRFRFLRGPSGARAAPGGPAMAMALKMLPCKKRRAAAAGPPSPRERGEDAELPGGSGAADGGGSARPAGRGPGEASPKSGRKPPVRAALSPGPELPAGPGSPAAAAAEGTVRGGGFAAGNFLFILVLGFF